MLNDLIYAITAARTNGGQSQLPLALVVVLPLGRRNALQSLLMPSTLVKDPHLPPFNAAQFEHCRRFAPLPLTFRWACLGSIAQPQVRAIDHRSCCRSSVQQTPAGAQDAACIQLRVSGCDPIDLLRALVAVKLSTIVSTDCHREIADCTC